MAVNEIGKSTECCMYDEKVNTNASGNKATFLQAHVTKLTVTPHQAIASTLLATRPSFCDEAAQLTLYATD